MIFFFISFFFFPSPIARRGGQRAGPAVAPAVVVVRGTVRGAAAAAAAVAPVRAHLLGHFGRGSLRHPAGDLAAAAVSVHGH